MGTDSVRPLVATDFAALRQTIGGWRRAGETIALVPTMGALHAGHVALVARARVLARRVAVSIFVNPTQFAPHEDLDRYPRNEAADIDLLDAESADLVWLPSPALMYPPGHSTRVQPGSAAAGLETEFRPHFFGGVATVVLKLFNQVGPDWAVFGEKDFQQLAVVRQLALDLDLPVTVVGEPTVREADGLALSSRNRYLSSEERAVAPALNATIQSAAEAARAGGDISLIEAQAAADLVARGFAKVDYVAIRDALTLKTYDAGAGREGRVLAAAWLGGTRLIDNVPIAA
ncbi:MAG: pantoate--beta-alanine ligase [Hyphomicrobiaceae bacterium]|nr:pantoate--beta-alanine ligase [Hyphomicrobiaceae bacterium]